MNWSSPFAAIFLILLFCSYKSYKYNVSSNQKMAHLYKKSYSNLWIAIPIYNEHSLEGKIIIDGVSS